MMDYKAMNTPMASNLKLLSDASSEVVNATMYHQMICPLMYLTDTRPDTLFVVNTSRHVHLMVASMIRIRILTWKVIWIQIGQCH